MNKQKQQRINRINEIKNIVISANKKGVTASYKKLIANYCIHTGVAKRTVKEYTDLLIESGELIKKGDDLDYIK